MSLIQQFLEDHLSKGLNSKVLEQIQNCNSSAEELITNIGSLRNIQKEDAIQKRINIVQKYLDVKKTVNEIMQIHSDQRIVINWLQSALVQSNKSALMFQLVKESQSFVKKQILKIARRTVLLEESENVFFEEKIKGEKIINKLKIILDQQSENKLSRQEIVDVDIQMASYAKMIECFQKRVQHFNLEMEILLKKITSFEQNIIDRFAQFIAVPQKENSNQIYHQKMNTITPNSKKSVSGFDKSRGNSVDGSEYRQNKLTPRKQLQVPYEEYDKESRNKRNTLHTYNNFFQQPEDPVHQKLMMNRTLNSFTPYRPPTEDMLYTQGFGGGQIRVSSRWRNSRSSISYHPIMR